MDFFLRNESDQKKGQLSKGQRKHFASNWLENKKKLNLINYTLFLYQKMHLICQQSTRYNWLQVCRKGDSWDVTYCSVSVCVSYHINIFIEALDQGGVCSHILKLTSLLFLLQQFKSMLRKNNCKSIQSLSVQRPFIASYAKNKHDWVWYFLAR